MMAFIGVRNSWLRCASISHFEPCLRCRLRLCQLYALGQGLVLGLQSERCADAAIIRADIDRHRDHINEREHRQIACIGLRPLEGDVGQRTKGGEVESKERRQIIAERADAGGIAAQDDDGQQHQKVGRQAGAEDQARATPACPDQGRENNVGRKARSQAVFGPFPIGAPGQRASNRAEMSDDRGGYGDDPEIEPSRRNGVADHEGHHDRGGYVRETARQAAVQLLDLHGEHTPIDAAAPHAFPRRLQ
ncbi:MAG: hypothetical protein WDN69_05540 [Aliidongia sp.]